MSSPPAAQADASPGAAAAIEAGDGGGGWEAALDLTFVADVAGGATRMVRGGQSGPLAVQRPFFPEGPAVCHVYLLHPPGGLVGGDRLRVGVGVAAGAHALLTTPAAAKIYRSAGPTSRQETRLRVAGGGALEWLPQETILYDGAAADLRTRVDLDGGARFIGTDLLCFGLPARGETFARGRCVQRLELWRDGRPLLIERGRFDGGAPVQAARWGLRGARVTGTLLAAPAPGAGATDGAPLAAIRALADALPDGDLGAATVLGGGDALICRYLGGSVERGGMFLRGAWAALRPALFGRGPRWPRIWAT